MIRSLRNPGGGSVLQAAGGLKGIPLPVSVSVEGPIMGKVGESRNRRILNEAPG